MPIIRHKLPCWIVHSHANAPIFREVPMCLPDSPLTRLLITFSLTKMSPLCIWECCWLQWCRKSWFMRRLDLVADVMKSRPVCQSCCCTKVDVWWSSRSPCLPCLLLWNWSICREAMFTFWQYVPEAERGGVLIYAWHKHFAGIWWPRACHTRASLHVLPQVKVPVQWLSVHRTCMQGSEKWKGEHTLYCQCAAHNLPFKITLWCIMVTSRQMVTV